MKLIVRGRSLIALTAALIVTAMVTSCADTSHASATSRVTCNSYAIQGSGTFHDEIRIRVHVANRPASRLTTPSTWS